MINIGKRLNRIIVSLVLGLAFFMLCFSVASGFNFVSADDITERWEHLRDGTGEFAGISSWYTYFGVNSSFTFNRAESDGNGNLLVFTGNESQIAFSGGDGSKENPFILSNVADFVRLSAISHASHSSNGLKAVRIAPGENSTIMQEYITNKYYKVVAQNADPITKIGGSIDFSARTFTAIGYPNLIDTNITPWFDIAEFDGNGVTFYGLTNRSGGDEALLFWSVSVGHVNDERPNVQVNVNGGDVTYENTSGDNHRFIVIKNFKIEHATGVVNNDYANGKPVIFSAKGVILDNIDIVDYQSYSMSTTNGSPIGLFLSDGRNCFISNITIDETSFYKKLNARHNQHGTAMVVGRITNGEIRYCVNNGTLTADGAKYGIAGIAGSVRAIDSTKVTVVDNCINNGKLIGLTTSSSFYTGGGIVGYMGDYSGQSVFSTTLLSKGETVFEITNCVNNGNIFKGGVWVGGIIGYYAFSQYVGTYSAVIDNCINNGNIDTWLGTDRYSSGVISSPSDMIIKNSGNTGTISYDPSGEATQGYIRVRINGFAYYAENCLITDCFNEGNVLIFSKFTGADSYNNSAIGFLRNATNGTIVENCYNSGRVQIKATTVETQSQANIAAGFCDTFAPGTQVSNCYNSGIVANDTGIAVGFASIINTSAKGCYNSGIVRTNINYTNNTTIGVFYRTTALTEPITISGCYNTGTILGRTTITFMCDAGLTTEGHRTTLIDCYNSGEARTMLNPAVAENPDTFGMSNEEYGEYLLSLYLPSSFLQDMVNVYKQKILTAHPGAEFVKAEEVYVMQIIDKLLRGVELSATLSNEIVGYKSSLYNLGLAYSEQDIAQLVLGDNYLVYSGLLATNQYFSTFGYVYNADIINCGNTANGYSYYAYGLVYLYTIHSYAVNIEGCYNTGTLYGHEIAGLINNAYHTTITNSYNSGDIYCFQMSAGNEVGGLFSQIREGSIAINCLNTGDIYSFSLTLGGIVGRLAYDNYKYGYGPSKLINCVNMGDVNLPFGGVEGGIGGIVGSMYCSPYIVEGCINMGRVGFMKGYKAWPYSSHSFSGGIAGTFWAQGAIIADGETDEQAKDRATFSVRNCINYGDVYGSYAGGLFGRVAFNIWQSGYRYSRITIDDNITFGEVIGVGSRVTTTDDNYVAKLVYEGKPFYESGGSYLTFPLFFRISYNPSGNEVMSVCDLTIANCYYYAKPGNETGVYKYFSITPGSIQCYKDSVLLHGSTVKVYGGPVSTFYGDATVNSAYTEPASVGALIKSGENPNTGSSGAVRFDYDEIVNSFANNPDLNFALDNGILYLTDSGLPLAMYKYKNDQLTSEEAYFVRKESTNINVSGVPTMCYTYEMTLGTTGSVNDTGYTFNSWVIAGFNGAGGTNPGVQLLSGTVVKMFLNPNDGLFYIYEINNQSEAPYVNLRVQVLYNQQITSVYTQNEYNLITDGNVLSVTKEDGSDISNKFTIGETYKITVKDKNDVNSAFATIFVNGMEIGLNWQVSGNTMFALLTVTSEFIEQYIGGSTVNITTEYANVYAKITVIKGDSSIPTSGSRLMIGERDVIYGETVVYLLDQTLRLYVKDLTPGSLRLYVIDSVLGSLEETTISAILQDGSGRTYCDITLPSTEEISYILNLYLVVTFVKVDIEINHAAHTESGLISSGVPVIEGNVTVQAGNSLRDLSIGSEEIATLTARNTNTYSFSYWKIVGPGGITYTSDLFTDSEFPVDFVFTENFLRSYVVDGKLHVVAVYTINIAVNLVQDTSDLTSDEKDKITISIISLESVISGTITVQPNTWNTVKYIAGGSTVRANIRFSDGFVLKATTNDDGYIMDGDTPTIFRLIDVGEGLYEITFVLSDTDITPVTLNIVAQTTAYLLKLIYIDTHGDVLGEGADESGYFETRPTVDLTGDISATDNDGEYNFFMTDTFINITIAPTGVLTDYKFMGWFYFTENGWIETIGEGNDEVQIYHPRGYYAVPNASGSVLDFANAVENVQDFMTKYYVTNEGAVVFYAMFVKLLTISVVVPSEYAGMGGHNLFVNGTLTTANVTEADGTKKYIVEMDDQVKIIAIPASSKYYEFDSFNYEANGNEYTFNVTDSRTIMLTFKAIPQLLSFSIDTKFARGEVKVNKNTVTVGDTLVISFNANTGYDLSDWVINGVKVKELVKTNDNMQLKGNTLTIIVTEEFLDSNMQINTIIRTTMNKTYLTILLTAGSVIPILIISIAVFIILNARKRKQAMEILRRRQEANAMRNQTDLIAALKSGNTPVMPQGTAITDQDIRDQMKRM